MHNKKRSYFSTKTYVVGTQKNPKQVFKLIDKKIFTKHPKQMFNPLPHMLYLEHCIIFYKKIKFSNIFQKYFLHFNSFENIVWKMEHLLRSKHSIFHNILKNLTFQRRPKALVWSNGLN